MLMRILGMDREPERTPAIPIAGYKHSNVLLFAASLLCPQPIVLARVPDVLDTRLLSEILRRMGGTVERVGSTVVIETSSAQYRPPPVELTAPIHGAQYMMPAILGRFGKIELGPTGGCQIGGPEARERRPVDHVVHVLEKFGARFEVVDGILHGYCDAFKGTELDILEFSTRPDMICGPEVSGATKTAMLAGAAAKGRTVIHNPHYKEAQWDLARFLRRAGWSIEASKERIVIEDSPSYRIAAYEPVSDTTEIVTYVAAAVYLKRRLRLFGVTTQAVQRWLSPEVERLEKMGVEFHWEPEGLYIQPPSRVRAVDVEASSEGLCTDSQPFFTLMLTGADRPSRVRDLVWSHRFRYATQLLQLGADLRIDGDSVLVNPRRPYIVGQHISAIDTRAGAVLVLAALGINGETTIDNLHHVGRGYEDFAEKLKRLGARLEVSDERAAAPAA